jgi:iron complex transport system substrate-binding protein
LSNKRIVGAIHTHQGKCVVFFTHAKARRREEELSAEVVDAAFHLHKDLGPGVLESGYEVVVAKMLEQRGLAVVRQPPIPIQEALAYR